MFTHFSRVPQNIRQVHKILENYPSEGSKILDILEERLCLLSHIVCMKDNETIYRIEDHFELYNQ